MATINVPTKELILALLGDMKLDPDAIVKDTLGDERPVHEIMLLATLHCMDHVNKELVKEKEE
jgi:hypothetical protein